MIGLGSPFRPPCGGWLSPILGVLGSREQHCNSGDNGKAVYTNVTQHSGSAIAPASTAPTEDACAGGDAHVSQGGDGSNFNCYHAAGTTANFSMCRQRGFKNLVAAKFWQGVGPFTGAGADQCDGGADVAATANQTRYLTRAFSGTHTTVITGGATTTHTGSTQYTQGRWTGVVAQDTCTYDDSGGPGTPNLQATGMQSINYQCGVWGTDGIVTPTAILAALNGDTSAGTVNSVSTSATSISFSVTIPSTGVTDTYTCTITLSNPYTATDLWNDVCAMLTAQAGAFIDNTIYPFRTDASCFLAPLLTVDENTSGSLVAIRDCGWTDSATNTGNVIGGFVPAGYGPFFDKNHKNYTDPSTPDGTFGAFSPDWCPRAMQWLNLAQGSLNVPGYWAGYHWNAGGGVLLDGCLVIQVWAETILFAKPSHNFARPCGPADAAAIDQPTATCTGSTLTGTLRWPGIANPCPVSPASGYAWNDTGRKGQFISKHWTHNEREIAGGYASRPVTGELKAIDVAQQCIAHTPCCPNVAYISPVTFAFSNAVQITPSALPLDDVYGAFDQWAIEQWMTDPLYQPPKQCPTGGPWNEDDGTCAFGEFPLRPYEEAILAVPTGAPALPSGSAFVDYAGYIAGRNSGAIPSQIAECEPPKFGLCQSGDERDPRWITLINQESNCCQLPAYECDDYEP